MSLRIDRECGAMNEEALRMWHGAHGFFFGEFTRQQLTSACFKDVYIILRNYDVAPTYKAMKAIEKFREKVRRD